MYLAIDIGGTKTLLASLTNEGVITERVRFETPKDYTLFLKTLKENIVNLSTKEFVACGAGVPGLLDREKGIAIAMGNLPWRNAPIFADIQKLLDCPLVIENDSRLGALSEAMLLKEQYNRVLYVTIGTGIGIGFIVDQAISPALQDSESGKMPLEHDGKMVAWEDFASGRAIKARTGKFVREITEPREWRRIAHDIAIGLIDLIATFQPEVIVLGGGVSAYYDEYLKKPLAAQLAGFGTPMIPIPPIREAARPDDAVLYGCYDLAKARYGHTRS